MAAACSCKSSCLGKTCGRVWRVWSVWGWANGKLELPWKGLRPAGGFGGFEGGQTAGLNAVKTRWLGHVTARVVALERPAGGFEGFEAFEGGLELPWKGMREGLEGLEGLKGGQTADGWVMQLQANGRLELPWKGLREGLKSLKRLRVGKRQAWVALERIAWGFGGFEGGQTAGLNALKTR